MNMNWPDYEMIATIYIKRRRSDGHIMFEMMSTTEVSGDGWNTTEALVYEDLSKIGALWDVLDLEKTK